MTKRAETNRYFVGIDAGSVSLNALVINGLKAIVYEPPYRRHFGKVEEETLSLIRHLYEKFGQENIRSIAFTGNHGKHLSDKLGLFYEFETISQVLGVLFLKPDTKTIISMGGQDTALFQIRHRERGPSLTSKPNASPRLSMKTTEKPLRFRSTGSCQTSSPWDARARNPPMWHAAARFSPSPT